jgi:hypothetical protein
VASWLPEEAGDADRHIEWARGLFTALEPHSRGVYVNFTSDDVARRGRQAYAEGQWVRLAALKAKYDPTNFFRMNANILAGCWITRRERLSDLVRAGVGALRFNGLCSPHEHPGAVRGAPTIRHPGTAGVTYRAVGRHRHLA